MEIESTASYSVIPPTSPPSEVLPTLPYSDGPPSYESVLPPKIEDTSDPPSYPEINSKSLPRNSENNSQNLPYSLQPNNQTLGNIRSDNAESDNSRNTSGISSAPPAYDINDPVPIPAYNVNDPIQIPEYQPVTPPPYELNPNGMFKIFCYFHIYVYIYLFNNSLMLQNLF